MTTVMLALLLADPGRPATPAAEWPGAPRVALRVAADGDLDVWCSRPLAKVAWPSGEEQWAPLGAREMTAYLPRGVRRAQVWSVDDRGRPWAKWFDIRGRR